jgi:hypothetical protein
MFNSCGWADANWMNILSLEMSSVDSGQAIFSLKGKTPKEFEKKNLILIFHSLIDDFADK